MIDWAFFIPACFALNLTFGPNNLLAMTNGARSGIGFSLKASLGRLLVFIPMIALSALGLGVVLTTSAMAFGVVKLVGAAYLIWLGVSLWRSAKTLEIKAGAVQAVTLKKAFVSEALVAMSNPKAILIFAAFFPQFVPMESYWQGYALLGGSFLLLESVGILLYATVGKFASDYGTAKLPKLQQVSGITMCVFGVLLLLSPQPGRS